MKGEHDFSKAERGRFHRSDAVLTPPVHLEAQVLAFLTARAQARGVSLSELVNALLKKDPDVKKYLSDAEIDEQFDLGYHLKHVDTIFKRVFGEA